MPFEVKDVLIVDATVIIGLLILLSFQSISSTFIENEASDFMGKWNETKNTHSVTLGLLEDWNCIEGKTAFENTAKNNPKGFDHVSKEMEDEIKKNCSAWLIESLEQERYLMELNRWGYEFNYLQQRDFDGVIYTAGTQMDMFYDMQGGAQDYYDPYLECDEEPEGLEHCGGWVYAEVRFASFNPEFDIEESHYFEHIVTGPFYVNQWNMLMIVPFIVSAAIASFNTLRKNEETNHASKAAVIFMGIGFVILFFGLMVILYAFFQVNLPYLDQVPASSWDCEYDESGHATACEMRLVHEPLPPETRNLP